MNLPYQISFKNAAIPFDLIHFDIWGPIAIKSINVFHIFLLLLMIIVYTHGLPL